MSYDVFLSYAKMNDEPVFPGDESTRWVSSFVSSLRTQLLHELGREPAVFFDAKDLSGNRALTPDITSALDSSSLFVAVHSVGYHEREWCRLECRHFISTLGADPAGAGRVFVIHIMDMDKRLGRAAWQQVFFPDVRGYFFFRPGTITGDEEQLGTPSLDARTENGREYFKVLRRLAVEMAASIREMKSAPAVPAPPPAAAPVIEVVPPAPGREVYLADTAIECQAMCRDLRARLEKEKFTVRPPQPPGPLPEAEFRAAAAREMRDALAFVQLLGPAPFAVPSGGGATYERLVREAAGALRSFYWRPADLAVDATLYPGHREFIHECAASSQPFETFKDDLVAALEIGRAHV